MGMRIAILAMAYGVALLVGICRAQDGATALLPGRQGEVYVGHRYYLTKGIGWGWIKKPKESWSRAKWVALKEQPDKGLVAPFRQLGARDADHMHEYELVGYFADYKAYDPKFNDLLPVFVILGYKPLGLAKKLDLKPGSRGQISEGTSTASSRADRPIIQQRGTSNDEDE